MLTDVHKEMTLTALKGRMSERALEIVVAANISQDAIRNQIGHDEIHFDNNAISQGNAYIKEQCGYILASLMSPGVLSAWIAFGRLIHTAQDFYSHTNYVTMWLDQQNGSHPTPLEIDPLKKDLINHPSLHSGKVYLPMDAMYFIPFMRNLALSLLPKDSHGWMNLDTPAQGPKFPYAIAAATKRTTHEFELLQKLLTPEMLARFIDK